MITFSISGFAAIELRERCLWATGHRTGECPEPGAERCARSDCADQHGGERAPTGVTVSTLYVGFHAVSGGLGMEAVRHPAESGGGCPGRGLRSHGVQSVGECGADIGPVVLRDAGGTAVGHAVRVDAVVDQRFGENAAVARLAQGVEEDLVGDGQQCEGGLPLHEQGAGVSAGMRIAQEGLQPRRQRTPRAR
jgi:hypothetical protein